MLKCEKIQEMMSLYIDGQLNDIELINFNKHIKECEQCKKELAFLQSIVQETNSLEELELPDDFNKQLHKKLIAIQETTKANTPPWYLNWRVYSSFAACILLVFVLKSQAFDSIYNSIHKTEKAYVNDTNLQYSAEMAMEGTDEIKDMPKQEMKIMSGNPDAPVSSPRASIADNTDGGKNTAARYRAIDGTIKQQNVHRGLYREQKSLIVYNAIINPTQDNWEKIWGGLKAELPKFDGYYEVRFKDEKPKIYISKNKYDEFISSVRATGLEFTIKTGYVDRTEFYHNLIDEYDEIQKNIEELYTKLEKDIDQESRDNLNNKLQALIEKQIYLSEQIDELDNKIGKYIIEIHIVP